MQRDGYLAIESLTNWPEMKTFSVKSTTHWDPPSSSPSSSSWRGCFLSEPPTNCQDRFRYHSKPIRGRRQLKVETQIDSLCVTWAVFASIDLGMIRMKRSIIPKLILKTHLPLHPISNKVDRSKCGCLRWIRHQLMHHWSLTYSDSCLTQRLMPIQV